MMQNILPIVLVLSALATGSSYALSTSISNLVYFDAKGAAELSRILASVGGYQYNDIRYSIKVKEGGGFETPEFTSDKENGLLKCNMNRAPMLVLANGVKIGQSRAIERYISMKCNLLGNNDDETALIDCICENVRDIKDKYSKIRFTTDATAKADAMKKWFDTELHEWYVKLDDSLPDSAISGNAISNKLTYADITLWHLMTETFTDNKESSTAAYSTCKKLCSINNNVSSNQKLKDYLMNRPKTNF